jgi:O-acetyl-ADP-ribose deacetylase (regulator of RNase III)
VTISAADANIQGSFLNGRVVVIVGDITKQRVTALVNAANSTLLGGGGVDGAIHKAGGPQILKECQQLRQKHYPKGLPTGQAVVTTAGNLPAEYVIHTVGPIYGRDREQQAQLLAACYQNSLLLAPEYRILSIAFPSISTGAFGYPRAEAAAIASLAIKEGLAQVEVVEQVRLVFFQESDARVFLQYQIFE